MNWPAVPLKELLLLHDAGVWGPEDRANGISVLRSTNFNADGSIRFDNLSFRSVEPRMRETKRLAPNDIILEKSGGGPKQPVGRVCFYRGHHLEHAFGNFTARLRANDSIVDPEYLFWCLHQLHLTGRTAQYQRHTSGIRNLETKRYLTHEISVPPLDEQRRIIGILNRAARIERLRIQAADRLREFIPALFIKMFGDPIANPMGWDRQRLGDVSEVQGGLQVTKKRASHLLERPYLRVANVLRDQLVLDEIKRIRITKKELDRVRLRSGDLLVVEGHGNAAEIGRLAIWDGSVCDCVHQNHLIRVRPDRCVVTSEYVCAFLNSSSGRQHLLRRGKTTSGLNTITTSDVRDCGILVPSLDAQQLFSRTVIQTLKQKKLMLSSAHMASTLTISLMSHCLENSM